MLVVLVSGGCWLVGSSGGAEAGGGAGGARARNSQAKSNFILYEIPFSAYLSNYNYLPV